MSRNKNILSIVLLLLTSCIQNDRPAAARAPTVEMIQIPNNYELYNTKLSKTQFDAGIKTAAYKIFTTINVSCATCLSKFDKWTQFQKEAGNCTNFMLVPVCVSKDKFELIKYLFESNKVDAVNYPLILDSSGSFGALNKQLSDEMSGTAILTNANNEVLLKGNPIENESDKQKFIRTLCSKTKEQ